MRATAEASKIRLDCPGMEPILLSYADAEDLLISLDLAVDSAKRRALHVGYTLCPRCTYGEDQEC